MNLIDDRGRVFGRLNPVDALVVAVVFVMMPVAYGAYALFRNPPAKLTAVRPPRLTRATNMRVQITGTNLRPFMRVSFNNEQGRTFLIGSTTSAEIDMPDLPPGVYDVVLYDYAQELDRLPKALTILPPVPAPQVSIDVTGSFVGLDEKRAHLLVAGMRLPNKANPVAEILGTGSRQAAAARLHAGDAWVQVALPGTFELPAALRLGCSLDNSADGTLRCTFYGRQPIVVGPDAFLTLPAFDDWIDFQVREIHASGPPVVARVRLKLAVGPDIVSRMKPGDRDTGSVEYPDAWIGRVESVRFDGGAADALVRLPVEHDELGWHYRHQLLKIGAPLRFETPEYVANGSVSDVSVPSSPEGRASSAPTTGR